MRILLVEPVLDGAVEKAVRLLRRGGVRVGSGATFFRDGAQPRGAITLQDGSQLQVALDLLAKSGVRAMASE